jgi:hypothetical protein
MTKYTSVQFVSWELYTGYDGVHNVYPGLRGSTVTDRRVEVAWQCKDIQARLAFTAKAMEKALAKADKSSDVLKVFMAPEFIYRGAGGAYLHDLINGWGGDAPADFGVSSDYKGWGGLFGGLKNLAANSNYADWVFVFGTAVSASFPSKEISPHKCVLDPSKPGEVYNTALIQRGGNHGADVYASRKHYISDVDFMKAPADGAAHVLTFNMDGSRDQSKSVQSPDTDNALREKLGDVEGGVVFQLASVCDASDKPITFGLEVCLDHAISKGAQTGDAPKRYGRLRAADVYAKIQLVPSCGMDLKEQSIRLLPATGPKNSYAFNCDGGGELKYTNVGGRMLRLKGSHTQIWNGANGAAVQAGNKLFEASSGETLAKTDVAKVDTAVRIGSDTIDASSLWSDGVRFADAGSVRVMPKLPL